MGHRRKIRNAGSAKLRQERQIGDNPEITCNSDRVSTALGDATARYLRQHVRERRRPAHTLVVKAVQPVFLCSKTPAKKR